MIVEKPKLSAAELVEHLKNKGVTFLIFNEKDAEQYLRNNNYYFKLASYRKNYAKHPDGENSGQYIDLDFAYLVDLATIDMKLRYQIIRMALDIEHHVKLQLLRSVEDRDGEDGYAIVRDYLTSLTQEQFQIADGELKRNRKSTYCCAIFQKYEGDFSIWAFIELIPFGRLVDFYRFCANRFDDEKMKNNYYMLLTCKEIRNAAAHSSCILNELRSNTVTHRTSYEVSDALMKIEGMNSNFRRQSMSNSRVQEIVTLLYMHKKLVISAGIHKGEWEDLQAVIDRMYKNSIYYGTNNLIKNTFDFLKKIVDNWA